MEIQILALTVIYIHSLCVGVAKALAKLYICARSSEPLLLSYYLLDKYQNLINWLIYVLQCQKKPIKSMKVSEKTWRKNINSETLLRRKYGR